MGFSLVTKMKHSTPAVAQICLAPIGPTMPAAGVMATRPVTMPEHTPSRLGLPFASHSHAVQVTPATAVPNSVLKHASPAPPEASNAAPALKPNQPIHSLPVPPAVRIKLCGAMWVLPMPLRRPSISAHTSAAKQELMCNTEPPAKSSEPCWYRKPAWLLGVSAAAALV